MGSYSSFADYYDSLTDNVEYKKRCDYFLSLMQKYNHKPELLLDLACGTGSLSLEFALKGVDVIGVDGSFEMLSKAGDKKYDLMETNPDLNNVLFLCQKMQNLDLYGTIDTAVCCLDSLNHLENINEFNKSISKVSLFLEEKGLFIFDVNTIYKHKEILGNNTFVYDNDYVYCVWQNEFEQETNKINIHLDFFEKEKDRYFRSEEEFSEVAFSCEQIKKVLDENSLELLDIFGDLTFEKPKDTEERLIYICRKV